MNAAIIPARGGSKRIPKKNIKMFNGKPMIYWSIKAANESNIFDNIFVSTDDEEIIEIAKDYGAEAPFIRSKELSDDFTGTAEVIKDGINQIEKLGYNFDNFCCIYPSSPLIQSLDLCKTLEILKSNDLEFVYPITEFSHPIHRSMVINDDGNMNFLFPENQLTRTQDLLKAYHDAGQFYWGSRTAWLGDKKMHSGTGFAIPNWRVVDIDNDDDWKRAELLFQTIKSKK